MPLAQTGVLLAPAVNVHSEKLKGFSQLLMKCMRNLLLVRKPCQRQQFLGCGIASQSKLQLLQDTNLLAHMCSRLKQLGVLHEGIHVCRLRSLQTTG